MLYVRIVRLLSRIFPPMATISALSLILSGCGGAHFVQTPAPTVTITASPATIAAGSSATLTVATTDATSLMVTGSDGSSFTMSATGGTQTVTPAKTTTYTATATGLQGSTTATMTVTVSGTTPPPPAPTVTLTASPTSITTGSSSTLTVAATNATTVTISGTDGSIYTLQPTGGTQSVSPSATTTYTATATGTGGKVTAMATLTVTAGGTPPPAPTVTITAAPASISAGASSTLTVVATNATTVTIAGSDSSSYTLQASGGTQAVSPAATATYTVTATGAGGKATATATVTVTPAGSPVPTVTITASPASITAGGSSTLTVAATNATTVTVSGSDGTSFTLQPNGGTEAISPAATTTYTATATGAGGNASATATLTVTPAGSPAPTVTISANPTTVLAGNASTLTVAATNATGVTIAGSDGSAYTLAATGGTQSVSPLGNTTYTATATGTGGTTTATATVTVTPAGPPPAPTVSIVANPTSIAAGASSTLTVVAGNATGVVVTGSDGTSYTLAATGGTQAVSPKATTTYTATANGAGGTATATATVTITVPAPTVTITANPTTIFSGATSTLTVTATNATGVTVAGTDGSSYTLAATGGTQAVNPTTTTATTYTYTATATGDGGTTTATVTLTVNPAGSVNAINHVVFMLQENHTFDNYFGMLNPYRVANNFNVGDDGNTYTVDGIDDKLKKISNQDDQGDTFSLFKLKSTCVDDESSDFLSSYGDVNRYNFLTNRPIKMDGFVHNGEGYATSCAAAGNCSGNFTDLVGQRVMGYYDQDFLNYYYYMASQFALSNRWFSPVSSKSITNRIATFTGGTTQGLVLDPGNEDKLGQLAIPTIFNKLDKAGVSWKIYYTVSIGFCVYNSDECQVKGLNAYYPATDFSSLSYSYNFIYTNPTKAACTGTTQPSSVVGDTSNSFCIDINHIAPLSQYFSDVANGTLPSFAFIEAGYASSDEHPGSGQSVITGQYQVSTVMNAFMNSKSWSDSVFFFGYDEGGGPYEHVPPVPGHSNDNTAKSLGAIPDIASIAVNADTTANYFPCPPPVYGTATLHCDLKADWPGDNSGEAPKVGGFAAQLGFRVPNMVISPFTRKHYVSNIPMDHTAVLKFVEDRFIGDKHYLTNRDAAQPNLLDFFDFNNVPWATPPTPPNPVTVISLGHDPCNAAVMK